VDERGETLEFIELSQGEFDVDGDDFLGSFPLPSVPFRVVVSGLDESGITYERLFPNLFRVQSVVVDLEPATASNLVPIGTTTTFRATVQNLGETASFELQATATMGTVDRVSRDLLTLGAGEVGSVEVEVAVPADTAEGTEILLAVAASSTTEPMLSNSAVIELIASEISNLLPVANAGPDQVASVGSAVTLDAVRAGFGSGIISAMALHLRQARIACVHQSGIVRHVEIGVFRAPIDPRDIGSGDERRGSDITAVAILRVDMPQTSLPDL
jgi:hypothetical protein